METPKPTQEQIAQQQANFDQVMKAQLGNLELQFRQGQNAHLQFSIMKLRAEIIKGEMELYQSFVAQGLEVQAENCLERIKELNSNNREQPKD